MVTAMTETFDIMVIGGGIAGLSVAAELCGDAKVVVLETEPQPGYHATGRSAAILAQNYGNALIRALTAWSLDFFNAPPDWIGGPLLTPRGLMRIARPDQENRLRAAFNDMSRETALEWLPGREAEDRVPLLRRGHVSAAFYNPAAADIDVHGMLQGYLRRLHGCSGQFRGGTEVQTLTRHAGLWQAQTRQGAFAAPLAVNAAGAWADRLAGLAGAPPVGLEALRRSAVVFDAPAGCGLASMPMTVDADEDFYIKPEGGRLMASPGDETPVPPSDVRPEELDIAIAIDRVQTAFRVDVRRVHASWAGLRSFVADRAPAVGFDRDLAGFYWLAGQGGYGVQTAPALARLAADDLLCRSARLQIPGAPVERLTPARVQGKTQKQGTAT